MFFVFFSFLLLLLGMLGLTGVSLLFVFCFMLFYLVSLFLWNPLSGVPLSVGYYFSVSEVNSSLVILSFWVVMCMLIINYNYSYSSDGWLIFLFSLLVMLFVLFCFFVTDHFLVFFVLFELSLIPIFVFVMKWGYQPERFQAGIYMMLYTMVSSLPLFLCIIFLGESLGVYYMGFFDFFFTDFSFFLYFGCMMAFLVKLPLWGVHLWLPKAHVEANVSGSMILAGVLLKLGGYGLMKMSFVLSGCYGLIYFVLAVSLWSLFSVSLVCMTLIDIKQLIAYSSVVHMAMVVVSLFSFSVLGLGAAVIVMISHGLTSPIVFMLANVIYKMSGTRNLLSHNGIILSSSGLGIFWFLFLSSNMAAPPSLNFVGEVLVGGALVKIGLFLVIFVGLAIFMSGFYNLYLFSLTVGSYSSSYNKSVMSTGEILVSAVSLFLVFSLFLLSSSMLSGNIFSFGFFRWVFSSFFVLFSLLLFLLLVFSLMNSFLIRWVFFFLS